MNRNSLFIALLASAGLVGCAAPSHNIDEGGVSFLGGGYRQFKIGEGKYHIYVKTNRAPWSNTEAARDTWRAKAEAVCGSKDFAETQISESTVEDFHPIGAFQYIVSVRDGVATCPTAR